MATTYITRRLVRQSDGTLRVAFVDTHTGKEVTDPFSGKYQLIEQGNNLDFLNANGTSSNKDTNNKADQSIAQPYDVSSASGGGGVANAMASGDYGPTTTADGYARSPTNDFGYIDKPAIAKVGAFLPGPVGTAMKLGNVAINANNVKAVNAARQSLGLQPFGIAHDVVHGIMGQSPDVANVNIGQTPYSVGLAALDSKGRTTLTPNEARNRALTMDQPITEQTKAQQQQNLANFQHDFPNQSKHGLIGGIIGGVENVGKGVLNGVENMAHTATGLLGNVKDSLIGVSNHRTPQSFYSDVFNEAKSQGLSDVAANLAASQASLETGYGKSVKGGSYFGIKAGTDYTGKTLDTQTHEEVNGRMTPTTASFRSYDNLHDAVKGYVDFMSHNYPDALNAKTMPEAIAGLQTGKYGPYATDSKYGQKIGQIASTYAVVSPPTVTNLAPQQTTTPAEDQAKAPTTPTPEPNITYSNPSNVASLAPTAPTTYDMGISKGINPSDTGLGMGLGNAAIGSSNANGVMTGSDFGSSQGFSGYDSTAGMGFANGAPGYTGSPGGMGGNASTSIGNYGSDMGYSGIDASAGYGFASNDGTGYGNSTGDVYGGADNTSSFGGGFSAGTSNSNGGYGGIGGGTGIGGSYGGTASNSNDVGGPNGTAGSDNSGGLGGWGGW